MVNTTVARTSVTVANFGPHSTRCQQCSYANRPHARYCGRCGQRLCANPLPQVGYRSAQGRHQDNQDQGLIRALHGPRGETYLICIVADGVGGGPAGAYASRLAVAVACAELEQHLKTHELVDSTAWRDLVQRAVIASNSQVYSEAMADERLRGMGTTLSLTVITDHHMHIGHVGDSRIYRLSADGCVQRLTTDHTLAGRLEAVLALDAEAVAASRHILYRVIGQWPAIEVDTATVLIVPGDRVLLCSDGLSRALPDGVLSGLLGHTSNPQHACDALVALAAQYCDDDITVLLVEPARQAQVGL